MSKPTSPDPGRVPNVAPLGRTKLRGGPLSALVPQYRDIESGERRRSSLSYEVGGSRVARVVFTFWLKSGSTRCVRHSTKAPRWKQCTGLSLKAWFDPESAIRQLALCTGIATMLRGQKSAAEATQAKHVPLSCNIDRSRPGCDAQKMFAYTPLSVYGSSAAGCRRG